MVLENADQVKKEILDEISNLDNGHYVHRVDALLLIALGRDSYDVAAMYGHSSRSVHTWIHNVNEKGLKGLIDEKSQAGRLIYHRNN